MTKAFHELLLSELRMVCFAPGDLSSVTDEMLCQAVTVNENLRSLGFVLRPDDMIRLSASPSRMGFYESLKALLPDVKDKPMYPGFPQQVMEMSAAEFRLHQIAHYFSTYGLESLLGEQVSRGWLPEYQGPERTERDTALMECRVISLVPEGEAPIAVLKALLGRRETLTNPELELVLECAPQCTAEQMRGVKVRFKENIKLLFPRLMGLNDREAAKLALRAVCAHTGDVFRCAQDYLRDSRWRLATSEKKLMVKLLESYPVGDLKGNMMQSLLMRERNLNVLRHLDYNEYSRSAAHREAVRALRNGELLSWHGVGEALLRERSPQALAHYAQRPGYMLRMINRLLSLQYGREAIEEALLPHAGGVSGHLALKTIRTLMKRSGEVEEKYRQAVSACQEKYRQEEEEAAPTIARQMLSIQHRAQEMLSIQHRAQEMRDNAEEKWIGKPTAEAEAEAYRLANELKNLIEAKEKEINTTRRILNRISAEAEARQPQPNHRNANHDFDMETLYMQLYRHIPDRFCMDVDEQLKELDLLREEEKEARRNAAEELNRALALLERENRPRLNAERKTIEEWERAEEKKLRESHRQEYERYAQKMKTLPLRREKELAALEAQYQSQLKAAGQDAQTVEILKDLLLEHFRQAETPLKGKRVFLDLTQFDLRHSSLETEERSRDGGYIRSGISYRIPKEAKHVRFFVYWNDPHRVDIDLHAAGKTTDGETVHVGWNADFRNCGVVHSGDVTHSDAAEYIDIDLSAPIQEIYANVNLYSGKYSFKGVETCYVGLMAVDQMGQNVMHYDPANCFFTHALTQNTNNLFYGFIDVQNRFVRFVGKPNPNGWGDWTGRPAIEAAERSFSLEDYLNCVLKGQQAEIVDDPLEADVVLTMGKSLRDNGVSLVDSNFFLEC